jgi:hypothetical protein
LAPHALKIQLRFLSERVLFYQVRLFEREAKLNAVFELLKEVELPLEGPRLRFIVDGDYAALQSRSQSELGSDTVTLLIFNWTKALPSFFVYHPPVRLITILHVLKLTYGGSKGAACDIGRSPKGASSPSSPHIWA